MSTIKRESNYCYTWKYCLNKNASSYMFMDVFPSFECSPKKMHCIADDHVKESASKLIFIYYGSKIVFFFIHKKSFLLWKTIMVIKLLIAWSSRRILLWLKSFLHVYYRYQYTNIKTSTIFVVPSHFETIVLDAIHVCSQSSNTRLSIINRLVERKSSRFKKNIDLEKRQFTNE